MAEHHGSGGHDPSPHGGLPVGVPRRWLDLPDHDIDDAVEDVLLVPDVVVERHRVDTERLAELAHADSVAAALVGELEGSLKDPLLAQREPRRGLWICLGHHLEFLTAPL